MLNLIGWNVNGLTRRRDEIGDLIQKYQPDILLLQETFLKPNSDALTIHGYTTYRTDRTDAPRGGVAILINEGIEHEQVHLDVGKVELTTVQIHTKRRAINVGSIYLPTKRTRKKDLWKIKQMAPNMILAGDLNAKNEDWGSTKTDHLGKWIEQLCLEENISIHAPARTTRIGTEKMAPTQQSTMLSLQNHVVI